MQNITDWQQAAAAATTTTNGTDATCHFTATIRPTTTYAIQCAGLVDLFTSD